MTACSGGDSAPGRVNIAVIPKGTSHVFWQSIHAGARRAAKELDVDITWRGPLREDDRDSQVAEVENAVARRVSGIALAPLDESALVAPVIERPARGVPVVIFDSGLKGGGFISFVATDNDKGGGLAGEHLAKALGGRGKVILLRYAEGHDSTTRREEGFLGGVGRAAGHRDRQHQSVRRRRRRRRLQARGGAAQPASRPPTAASASTASSRPTNRVRSPMMRVLKDNGWAGQACKFIGFDASDGLSRGSATGTSTALVVQDPVRMGY